MTVQIYDRDGELFLDGVQFDLKIDGNRNMYVRKPGEKRFFSIGEQLEKGYTVEEKKRILYNYYVAITQNLVDSSTQRRPSNDNTSSKNKDSDSKE